MIPFTMNILNHSAGSFTVEYVPTVENCHSIKLNIKLDTNDLRSEEAIIEKLKLASPQDYWQGQLDAVQISNANQIADSLINTSHEVSHIDTNQFYGPVGNFIPSNQLGINAMVPEQRQSVAGRSTPEFVAPTDDQNVIKLKVLIQQVIQEMAEGTV